MEIPEKEHINAHLTELICEINCSHVLMAHLRQANCLGLQDIEQINALVSLIVGYFFVYRVFKHVLHLNQFRVNPWKNLDDCLKFLKHEEARTTNCVTP